MKRDEHESMSDTPQSTRRRLPLRVLLCRSCARETGIPGAVYCDECRPHRLSDVLLSDVDRARLNEH